MSAASHPLRAPCPQRPTSRPTASIGSESRGELRCARAPPPRRDPRLPRRTVRTIGPCRDHLTPCVPRALGSDAAETDQPTDRVHRHRRVRARQPHRGHDIDIVAARRPHRGHDLDRSLVVPAPTAATHNRVGHARSTGARRAGEREAGWAGLACETGLAVRAERTCVSFGSAISPVRGAISLVWVVINLVVSPFGS